MQKFLLVLALAALAIAGAATPKCHPKLSKASMLQRSTKARAFVASKRPDPTCATGVASLAGAVPGKTQACCPAYCKECTDYETCKSARGQNSENACCATKVLSLECGGPEKTPANVCLKQCSETNPPCIMAEGVEWTPPETTSAAEDCGEAVDEWMGKVESAVKAGEGGDDQWTKLNDKGDILKLAQVKAHDLSNLQLEEGRWVLALDRDLKTEMLIQVKHAAPTIKDPCGGLECSKELKCPAGFVSQMFPGHCCAYCVNPNVKVEKEAEGASGKYGGKESAMPACANVWCFPTLCTKPVSNPTTTNGQCCATCPAL